MGRATSTEPCGCESNETEWVKLCPEHFKLRENRLREVKLDSLEWLVFHYQRFPQPENLQHVIERLHQVGATVKTRPVLVQWILKNASLIKQASKSS